MAFRNFDRIVSSPSNAEPTGVVRNRSVTDSPFSMEDIMTADELKKLTTSALDTLASALDQDSRRRVDRPATGGNFGSIPPASRSAISAA
jgi:hypothetical protein